MMQFELPLDHEPCLNHLAILMANEDVENGVCLNWDAAYESAWNYLEEICDGKETITSY